jgi:hypothetical protein
MKIDEKVLRIKAWAIACKHALKALLASNTHLNTTYLLKQSFGQLYDYGREA